MSDPSSTPILSIIIVNWNVRDLLETCLRTLYEKTKLAAGSFEVLVVDNASSDDSVHMLKEKFPQIRLFDLSENLGFGRGNNYALPHAQGELILLLNPDTVIEDNAIGEMVRFILDDQSIWALGCRLINADRSLQRWTGGSFPTIWTAACHYLFLNYLLPGWLCPASLYLDRDIGKPIDVDWVSGAVLLLRRDHLEERIFDERFFMYGEDMELCYRLKCAGGRVVYTPTATVMHVQGASMKKQAGPVLKSSLEGLRAFYRMTTGGAGLWFIDLLTVVGFGLRSILYRVGSWIRPGRGYDVKADSCYHFYSLALRIMLGLT